MKKLIVVLAFALLCTGCSANSVDMFGAGTSSGKVNSLYGNKQSYMLNNYDIKQVVQPYDLILSDQDFSGPDNATGVDDSSASVILNEQQVANDNSGSGASKSVQEASGIEEYDFIFPVDFAANPVFTDAVGPRTAPVTGASTNHGGTDIGCPTGSAIYAAADGTVTGAHFNVSGGNVITINHGLNKEGKVVETVYMHNSELLVSVGQKVSQGDLIAKAGSTGYSSGPHCHFELDIGGEAYNAMRTFSGPSNMPGKRNGKFVNDGVVTFSTADVRDWADLVQNLTRSGN